MTLLLLDTTVLVDTERADSSLDAVVGDDDDVAVAAITVAELLVGVQIGRPSRRRAAREAFVDALLDAVPVVTYDVQVARSHAELLVAARHAGRPRGAHDLIIAATAHATRRTVVTSDASGFADLPGVVVRVAR